MKKLIYLLSISFLIFQSCSTNESTNVSVPYEGVLIKKIVASNGLTQDFTYNGNKLSKIISSDGGIQQFTYTGDFISKIEFKTFSYLFSYLNNNLTKVQMVSGNVLESELNYVYNTNGTITTTYFYKNNGDPNGSSPTTVIGISYYDTVGNKIKEEFSTDNSPNSIIYYNYDTNKTPYKNILGFGFKSTTGLYPFNIKASNNNLIKTSSNTNTNSYQYNSDGYPISETLTNSTGTTITSTYYY